jgi:hypothetical protein
MTKLVNKLQLRHFLVGYFFYEWSFDKNQLRSETLSAMFLNHG